MTHDEADNALMARLSRSGDARAFETLYRRHTQMLYATAVRITRDREAAADLVHDAWVRAVERGRRFEQRSTFRTWMVGILINLIRERARSERRNGPRHDPDESSAGDDPELEAAAPSTVDIGGVDPLDLDAAIAALPSGFRQVLVLHDVEGFTHEEIAEMLEIVPGTSKSQLARARQRVRQMITQGVPRSVR